MKTILILALILPCQMLLANSHDYSRVKNPPKPQPVVKPNVDSLTQSISDQQTSNTNHADLAGQVKDKSGSTKAIGYVAAGVLSYTAYKFAAKCAASTGFTPACGWAIAAGAGALYSLNQSRNVGVSEASACVSAAAVSTIGGACGSYNVTGTSTPQEIERAVDEAHKQDPTTRDVASKLAKVSDLTGAKFDAKTGQIDLPNGKSVNLNTATPDQMQTAGLDMGEMKKMINDAYNEAQEKLQADGIDGTEGLLAETNGSGASPAGESLAEEYIIEEGSAQASGQLGAKGLAARDPAAAGKSKIIRGELIGVAGDDIFGMITRRYAHLNKHQKHTFIQEVPNK